MLPIASPREDRLDRASRAGGGVAVCVASRSMTMSLVSMRASSSRRASSRCRRSRSPAHATCKNAARRGDVGHFHGLEKELILGHLQLPKNRLAFAVIIDDMPARARLGACPAAIMANLRAPDARCQRRGACLRCLSSGINPSVRRRRARSNRKHVADGQWNRVRAPPSLCAAPGRDFLPEGCV